jgi:hypothetical protein
LPDGTRDETAELDEQGAGEKPQSDVVREAIGLTKRIDELKLELAPLEDKLKALQPELVAEFERSGDQRRTVDGKTAYLHRQLWVYAAEGKPKDAVMAAMKEAGLGDYVNETFNIQSVSAFARELEKDVQWEESGALLEDAEHPLLVAHPELKGFLVPNEKFSVRIVAA